MEELSELLVKSHQGDEGARRILIEKNLGLVHLIVRRFGDRGYDSEELFQVGCIGLMKAVDHFDIRFDVRFSTYAVPVITGEIRRFLRDDGMLKVSRSLKENGWKIKKAGEKLSQKNGREPGLLEIAEETGLTKEEILSAIEANSEVTSIYQTVSVGEEREIFLLDRLESGENEKEKLLNHIQLKELIDTLNEPEKSLIILRYFQGKTQVEVAKKLGLTQVQVSRLEKKVLLLMRKKWEGIK